MVIAVGASVAASTLASSLASGGSSGSGNTNANIGYLPPDGGAANGDFWQQYGQQQQLNPVYGNATPGGAYLNNTYGNQLSNTATNYYDQYQPLTTSTFNTAYNDANQQQTQGLQASNTINSNASQLSPYISQILNQGFDPQSALYNRTQQTNADQTNSSLAARGLNSSGVGAGIAAQNNSNFNIDWNAQQLQNESTALGAAGSAGNSAASQLSTGQTVGANATALPSSTLANFLNTSQTGTTAQESALTNYLNAQQLGYGDQQQSINNLLSYLGLSSPNSTLQSGNLSNQANNTQQQANTGNALSSLFGSAADSSSSGAGGIGQYLSSLVDSGVLSG